MTVEELLQVMRGRLRSTPPDTVAEVDRWLDVIQALEMLSGVAPRTTAEATPNAPTRDSQWVAGREPTAPTTPPSSLLDPAGIESGPAEPDSGCVHETAWLRVISKERQGSDLTWLVVQCQKCAAFWSFVATPAPAAAPTSSTSAKQRSNNYSEMGRLAGELTRSQSSGLINRCTPPRHYYPMDADRCDCGEVVAR